MSEHAPQTPAGLDEYRYSSEAATWDDSAIFNAAVAHFALAANPVRSVFEIGCGNGHGVKKLRAQGFSVTAIEASASGAQIAQAMNPDASIAVARVEDDLAARFGQFDAVFSLEVIEHIYSPRMFARRCFELLKPGGVVALSTPYHGYWKNLAIALLNKHDTHTDPLWEHGHIKFFSRATLAKLFAEQAMPERGFRRVGRIPALAKSMVVCFQKPLNSARPSSGADARSEVNSC
jgi:2-polyprenyl-3-methyl-5-hydroxy-6-metoxy-1,4-benzoquinol methylase